MTTKHPAAEVYRVRIHPTQSLPSVTPIVRLAVGADGRVQLRENELERRYLSLQSDPAITDGVDLLGSLDEWIRVRDGQEFWTTSEQTADTARDLAAWILPIFQTESSAS